MQYGYDRLGSYDNLQCSKCKTKQKRSELQLCSRYDGYDEQGEPIWIEDYWGCINCTSDDVDMIK